MRKGFLLAILRMLPGSATQIRNSNNQNSAMAATTHPVILSFGAKSIKSKNSSQLVN